MNNCAGPVYNHIQTRFNQQEYQFKMSSAEESRQARVIGELKSFIKKVLSDPTVAVKCMEIARKHKDEADVDRLMAEEISAATTVRIPEIHSDADKIFLELLKEVREDEDALY